MSSTQPITARQEKSFAHGTCHFAVMLAPTRRTLVRLIYPSGVGLIQNDLGLVWYEREMGYMYDKGTCAPVVLMLFIWVVPPVGWMKGFQFPLVRSAVVTDSFGFHDHSQTDMSDVLAVMWSSSSQLILRLYELTLLLASSLSLSCVPLLFQFLVNVMVLHFSPQVRPSFLLVSCRKGPETRRRRK